MEQQRGQAPEGAEADFARHPNVKTSTPKPDFINSFMDLTVGQFSPEIFRRWTAISLLAGAVERRVWTLSGEYTGFLNMYIMLVARPGSGKFIIEKFARRLWAETKIPGTTTPAFHVTPTSVTKASLMDCLAAAHVTRQVPKGPPLEYHMLQVAAEEFGMFMPSWDSEFVYALNSVWSNPGLYDERRRASLVKALEIRNPTLNIICGAQPKFLSSILNDENWATGFGRRIVMIYSGEKRFNDLFAVQHVPQGTEAWIRQRLSELSIAYGQITWSPEAEEFMRAWFRKGGEPIPTHSKLEHYLQSRNEIITKLMGISVISRGQDMTIKMVDVERVLVWILEAEKFMPDVFREMAGKSDSSVLEELHRKALSLYAKSGHKPIPSQVLWLFLKSRVASPTIPGIMFAAERCGIISKFNGTEDLWVPNGLLELDYE